MDYSDSDFLTAGVLETTPPSHHFNNTEAIHTSNKKMKISTSHMNVRRNKIECVHESLDDARVAIDLLGTLTSFLDATTTKNDKNQSDCTTVVAAKEAICACVDILEGHIKTVSNLVNHTKERSSSKQAHSKLTKRKRHEAQHAKLEMNRAIMMDPKKALKTAIQNARASVQRDAVKPAVIDELDSERRKTPDESNDTLASASLPPRIAKKPKISDAAKQEVMPPRVPRPQNGLMYHPFELKDALIELETNTEQLSGTKNKNTQRSFKAHYKQEIINRGYVPIKMTAINKFALKYIETDAELPLYWNQKGRRDYMSVDDLYAKYQERKFAGCEWTIDDTKEAVFGEKKARVITNGKDPNQVRAPEKKTVDAYHSALMSMVSKRAR